MSIRLTPAMASILCLLASGCGSERDPNRPLVFPTSATVTHNGKLVDGARVFFSLQGGSRGATAVTDAQGVARLTTFDEGDGAVAGTHSVKIEKIVEETRLSDKLLPDSNDFDIVVTRKVLLPARYATYKTSGLSAEVTETGPNAFQFELTGNVGSAK